MTLITKNSDTNYRAFAWAMRWCWSIGSDPRGKPNIEVEEGLMQTPHRMTLPEFQDAMRGFLDLQCLQRDRSLWCFRCGAPIASSTVKVSIHDSLPEGECVSNRWTLSFFVPYCPRCEAAPDGQGCVHLAAAEVRKAS